MMDRIMEITDRIESAVIDFRRKMHRWPEIGGNEFKTTELIKRELEDLGIEVADLTPTGCVGLLKGGKPGGRCVALRADIDALPMTEETGLDYASEREGIMHACGHDMHSAILIGAAKVLGEIREELTGTVKFIFQPSEETVGGAVPMIKAGCMENPKVDYILGLHVEPRILSGAVGIKYGQVYASSDVFELTIHGRKTHGAHPEHGVDAIVAGANVVTALQGIVSRNVAPTDAAVITIGTFHAGTAMNIVADKAEMFGTIRTLTPKTRAIVKGRLIKTVESVAEAYGATAYVKMTDGYESLINDEDVTKIVENEIKEVIGSENIIHLKEPSLGVEDFAFYLNEAPGTYYFLGCGYHDRDNAVIHSGEFEPDEGCIRIGIQLQVACCLKLMKQ
jgi:amidohydrolase